jgi:hypothetical protein
LLHVYINHLTPLGEAAPYCEAESQKLTRSSRFPFAGRQEVINLRAFNVVSRSCLLANTVRNLGSTRHGSSNHGRGSRRRGRIHPAGPVRRKGLLILQGDGDWIRRHRWQDQPDLFGPDDFRKCGRRGSRTAPSHAHRRLRSEERSPPLHEHLDAT